MMQMQIPIPASSSTASSSYMPSTSLTSFPASVEGGATALNIPRGMRRVISSPSKNAISLRDAAHFLPTHTPTLATTTSTATHNITNTATNTNTCIPMALRRCRSQHRIGSGYEHEYEQTEDVVPTASFLRESEYLTKQAIKQMAEHRVLLDASRKGLPNKSTLKVTTAKTQKRVDVIGGSGGGIAECCEDDEDDEYAWYFKNSNRYLWRPRTSGSGMQTRPAVVMHGELRVELDPEANKSLFAAYLTRHYGLTTALDGERGAGATTTANSHHFSPQAQTYDYNNSKSNRAWSDAGDTATSDGSTAVFWFDEQWASRTNNPTASSPTLASASLHTTKRASEDLSSEARRSTSSGGPVVSRTGSLRAEQKTGAGGDRRRWSSSSRLASGGGSGGPARAHHRRFSFLRLFSA